MTNLNFDLADPKCDVEKLFINFLRYYDEEIIHGKMPDASVDKFNLWAWIDDRIKSTIGGEVARVLCEELLSVWSQAGFIKQRKPKYLIESVCSGKNGIYVFTTKGLKLKRRKH
jgi:hypothetical protein